MDSAGTESQDTSTCCSHDSRPEPAPLTAEQRRGMFTCPMHPEVVRHGPGSCPECGMALDPMTPGEQDHSELDDMTRRLKWSAALTIPLVVGAMSEMFTGMYLAGALGSERALNIVMLIVAAPVVLWGGWPFFARAVASVRARSLNMFTLIGLGVSVAFAYSVVATLAPDLFPAAFQTAHGAVGVYYEVSASIVTLVLLGQVIELRARSRTGAAVQSLMELAPPTAMRVDGPGHDEEIPLAAVQVGDRLRVVPGAKIPVDGMVVEGHSNVDESMVTGEAVPVPKEARSGVIGGTVNTTGGLVVEAERVGSDTVLSQIVQLVADAQRTRAPIQSLADRFAAVFVPAVVLVAAVAAVLWFVVGPEPQGAHALVAAVSVLIIACPCALGLATPMSITVAMGRGASMGILFRDATAVEALRDITTLVVDKTGTLTEGRPTLQGVIVTGPETEESVLQFAASLERHSEHPLASAIVAGARDRAIELRTAEDFMSLTGSGITGKVDGRQVAVGNAGAMTEVGADSAEHAASADELRGDGRTAVFVAVDGTVAGILSVADPIKPTARNALHALHTDGVRVVMATGDNATTAQAVALELGIDDVRADVQPADKARIVRELQDRGERVAMAGDGINDAPALAQADVGIAMGTGTDVAMETAAVTLVKGDLGHIARARGLSRATIRNIKQNLVFAFGYNTIGVPIAAGVLYPVTGLLLSPIIAAAAMSFSSVSVIGNALRLRRATL